MIYIITKEQAELVKLKIEEDGEKGLAQSDNLSYAEYALNHNMMIMSYLVAVELGNDTYRTIKDRFEESGKIISGAYLRKKIEYIMNKRMDHECYKQNV